MTRKNGHYSTVFDLAPVRWVARHRRLSFGVAALVFAQMWSGAAKVVEDAGTSAWLDWLVLASVAYGILGVLILVPRVLLPRAQGPAPAATALLIGMAMSVAPFLVAFACYVNGADSWVMPVGFVTTTALLGLTILRSSPDATA